MYSFIKSFPRNFKKNIGIEPSSDDLAYIKSVCEGTEPYRKVDNKGRNSEYFTFLLNDTLVTVVCDACTKRILTAVIEVHNRPQFLRGGGYGDKNNNVQRPR